MRPSELVREIPFDAVLCDHRMAGMAGTEVFDAIVAVRPELERRFVFMSGDVLNPELTCVRRGARDRPAREAVRPRHGAPHPRIDPRVQAAPETG